MVQRANFAFDDEELSGFLGRNEGYWQDDEQEEELDPDLSDLPDLAPGAGFSEIDLDQMHEQFFSTTAKASWETVSPQEENKQKSPQWTTDSQKNQG